MRFAARWQAVSLASVLLALSWAGEANASGFPSIAVPFQAQMLAVAGAEVSGPGFGVGALQVNTALLGLGVAAELGVERLRRDESLTYTTSYLSVAAQWRVLGTLRARLYQYLDPHIDAGLVGGAAFGDGFAGRAGFYTAIGADFPLGDPSEEAHFVLTTQYRHFWSQTPRSVPDDFVLIGVGARVMD